MNDASRHLATSHMSTLALGAAIPGLAADDETSMQAHLDTLSWELLCSSSAARDDEWVDFRNLARGATARDVEAKIADNLAFGAQMRRLTTPDAKPHGETYAANYADEYRRLRRERVAKGGVLDSDPDQQKSWARGGHLTAREQQLRTAAHERATSVN